jgi:hypothetical protein
MHFFKKKNLATSKEVASLCEKAIMLQHVVNRYSASDSAKENLVVAIDLLNNNAIKIELADFDYLNQLFDEASKITSFSVLPKAIELVTKQIIGVIQHKKIDKTDEWKATEQQINLAMELSKLNDEIARYKVQIKELFSGDEEIALVLSGERQKAELKRADIICKMEMLQNEMEIKYRYQSHVSMPDFRSSLMESRGFSDIDYKDAVRSDSRSRDEMERQIGHMKEAEGDYQDGETKVKDAKAQIIKDNPDLFPQDTDDEQNGNFGGSDK